MEVLHSFPPTFYILNHFVLAEQDMAPATVARRLLDSCDFTLAVVFWDGLANALRLTEIVHNSTTDSHTYTGSQKR